jgi:hypothetical protein
MVTNIFMMQLTNSCRLCTGISKTYSFSICKLFFASSSVLLQSRRLLSCAQYFSRNCASASYPFDDMIEQGMIYSQAASLLPRRGGDWRRWRPLPKDSRDPPYQMTTPSSCWGGACGGGGVPSLSAGAAKPPHARLKRSQAYRGLATLIMKDSQQGLIA